MPEWIKCSERLPEKPGRYLIFLHCKTGRHVLLAKNWSYPCCEANFAYFCAWNGWSCSSDLPTKIEPTFWAECPQKPIFEYSKESE